MIKNGLINLVGQVFKVGSSILVVPILVKFLGLSTFGLLSWSTAILAAIQLAEGGLGSGLLYFLSEINLEIKDKKNDINRNQILTSGLLLLSISTVIILVTLWFASPFLVKTIGGVPIRIQREIEVTLKVGSFLAGLRIVQNFFWAILQSQNEYQIYSVVSTLQIIISNVLWAVLAFYGYKYLPLFLLSSVVNSVLFSFLLLFLFYRIIPNFKWDFNRKMLKSMITYNAGVWGSNVGSIMFSQGDKLIVANILGVSTLGVYTIFTNITTQLNQFTSQAVHPILPLISGTQSSQDNLTDIEIRAVKKYFLLNIYISLGGAGFCILFAPYLLYFFLKDNFQERFVGPFQLLSFIYGVYNLSVTGYYIMLGKGKSTKVMVVSFLSSALVLTAMYFLGRYIGFVALILGNSLFLLILILLFQGMSIINILRKDWISLLIAPLIATMFLIIVSLFLNQVFIISALISVIFLAIMIILFYSKYYKLSNC